MGRFLFLMIKKEEVEKRGHVGGCGNWTLQHRREGRGYQFELQILCLGAVLGHVISVALQEARGPWQLQSSVPSGPLGRAGTLPPGCRVRRGGTRPCTEAHRPVSVWPARVAAHQMLLWSPLPGECFVKETILIALIE